GWWWGRVGRRRLCLAGSSRVRGVGGCGRGRVVRGRCGGVRARGRGAISSCRCRWSCRVLLAEDFAAFVGGEAAPDAVTLPGFECPFEAGGLGGAHGADAFGVVAGL